MSVLCVLCLRYTGRRLILFLKGLFLLDTIYYAPPAKELDKSDRVFLSLGEGKEKHQQQAKPLSAGLWHRRLGHISY